MKTLLRLLIEWRTNARLFKAVAALADAAAVAAAPAEAAAATH